MKFTTKTALTNVRPVRAERGPVIIAGTQNVKIYPKVAEQLGIKVGDKLFYQKASTDESSAQQVWVAKSNQEDLGVTASYPSKKSKSHLSCGGTELLKTLRSVEMVGKELAKNEVALYQIGSSEVNDEGMTFRNLVFIGTETVTLRAKVEGQPAASTASPSKPSNVFSAPDAEAVTDELDLDEEEEEDESEEEDL